MRIRSFDLVARAEGCGAAMQVLEQHGAQVRRVVLLGSATPVRSSKQVTSLSLAEADAPDFGARLVQLLAGPT
jgi:pimeloyl-ACP methyl ester carboxylesterase